MGQILFLLMMVLPLGTFPVPVYFYVDWFGPIIYSATPYGILWYFNSLEFSLNTLWLDPSFLFLALPVIILNIIFVFEVVRYYKALVSRKHVMIVGALSFLVPLVYTVLVSWYFTVSQVYFGPLPFLLITGLLLLYRVPGPEVDQPDHLSILTKEEVV